MERPGHIHLVNFRGEGAQTLTTTISANLHISGHSVVELGDFLYIFGGYRSYSKEGSAEPSERILRIHIPSLLNGHINIEEDSFPRLFKPSFLYISRQGLREALIFNTEERSVWKFTAKVPRIMDQEPLHQELEVVSHEAEEDVSEEVVVPAPAQVDEPSSESESEDLQIPISDESDSSDSEEDEPLFCNSETCELNNLTIMEQRKLGWIHCLSCCDWFHERCLSKDKLCSACK